MNSPAARRVISFPHLDDIREARAIIELEGRALLDLAARLGDEFGQAVALITGCSGHVVVTGMGKAGLIGQKIAATFSSTGTRAHILHPAEAVHGDLGRLHAHDLLLVLSNSGETEEVCRLIPLVERLEVPIIAITASRTSTLGSSSQVVLELGKLREAGPHGLAPTTSTTAMLALGDALALIVGRHRGLTPEKFALFHPAGNLGAQLQRVEEVMRSGDELRIASASVTIREAFIGLGKPGRRTGAVMLVNERGQLSGLFTDSDLARLLEQRRDRQLDCPILEVMTRHPLTIAPTAFLRDALALLSERKVSELPVIDEVGRPVGLLDITDVIGLMPREPAA